MRYDGFLSGRGMDELAGGTFFAVPGGAEGGLVLRLLRGLNLRRKYGAPIVVVSGLPRSGTSMMMNMLRAAELPIVTDEERAADEDNPRGYFEDERVKELDKSEDKSWLVGCRGKVVKIISFLLTDLPIEHHYKVIFMRRDLEEVIASQNKMLLRRNEPVGSREDDEKMIKRYRFHLRKVEFLLEEEHNFDHVDILYGDALAQPGEQAQRVDRFLGMNLDVDTMAGAVDRSLYRNRRQAEAR